MFLDKLNSSYKNSNQDNKSVTDNKDGESAGEIFGTEERTAFLNSTMNDEDSKINDDENNNEEKKNCAMEPMKELKSRMDECLREEFLPKWTSLLYSHVWNRFMYSVDLMNSIFASEVPEINDAQRLECVNLILEKSRRGIC